MSAPDGSLTVMKRTDFGMIERCDLADKYTGKKEPKCDDGKGCIACWYKYNEYLRAHRPKMSADFKEFHDYISMHKRLLQISGSDFSKLSAGSLYDVVANLEKMIRTGSYRHVLAGWRRTLGEMHDGGRKKPAPKRLAAALK